MGVLRKVRILRSSMSLISEPRQHVMMMVMMMMMMMMVTMMMVMMM